MSFLSRTPPQRPCKSSETRGIAPISVGASSSLPRKFRTAHPLAALPFCSMRNSFLLTENSAKPHAKQSTSSRKMKRAGVSIFSIPGCWIAIPPEIHVAWRTRANPATECPNSGRQYSLCNTVLLSSSFQFLLPSLRLPAAPFSVSRFLQLLQLRHVLVCPSPESFAAVDWDGDAGSYLLCGQPTIESDPMDADSLGRLLGRVSHHASTYSIFMSGVTKNSQVTDSMARTQPKLRALLHCAAIDLKADSKGGCVRASTLLGGDALRIFQVPCEFVNRSLWR